jgi:hypothetical protein
LIGPHKKDLGIEIKRKPNCEVQPAFEKVTNPPTLAMPIEIKIHGSFYRTLGLASIILFTVAL